MVGFGKTARMPDGSAKFATVYSGRDPWLYRAVADWNWKFDPVPASVRMGMRTTERVLSPEDGCRAIRKHDLAENGPVPYAGAFREKTCLDLAQMLELDTPAGILGGRSAAGCETVAVRHLDGYVQTASLYLLDSEKTLTADDYPTGFVAFDFWVLNADRATNENVLVVEDPDGRVRLVPIDFDRTLGCHAWQWPDLGYAGYVQKPWPNFIVRPPGLTAEVAAVCERILELDDESIGHIVHRNFRQVLHVGFENLAENIVSGLLGRRGRLAALLRG